MGKEEKETKPYFGVVSFERRRHPRFLLDLPVEYWQINNSKSRLSHTINVSEGGLLIYLSEQIEIGHNLRMKLFFGSAPDLNCIEALVQVVWKDIHLGQDGNYRVGVNFVDISPDDLGKLKNFLDTLMNLKTPSELKIPSKLASILANSSTPNPLKPK